MTTPQFQGLSSIQSGASALCSADLAKSIEAQRKINEMASEQKINNLILGQSICVAAGEAIYNAGMEDSQGLTARADGMTFGAFSQMGATTIGTVGGFAGGGSTNTKIENSKAFLSDARFADRNPAAGYVGNVGLPQGAPSRIATDPNFKFGDHKPLMNDAALEKAVQKSTATGVWADVSGSKSKATGEVNNHWARKEDTHYLNAASPPERAAIKERIVEEKKGYDRDLSHIRAKQRTFRDVFQSTGQSANSLWQASGDTEASKHTAKKAEQEKDRAILDFTTNSARTQQDSFNKQADDSRGNIQQTMSTLDVLAQMARPA